MVQELMIDVIVIKCSFGSQMSTILDIGALIDGQYFGEVTNTTITTLQR